MRTSFIGDLTTDREAGGFHFGWWKADRYGDEVRPHGHAEAHFMYVLGGRYTTGAAGEAPGARPPFVFNPPDTYHADRFEEPNGLFFAVNLPAARVADAIDLGAPGDPTRMGAPRGYALLDGLMRETADWSPDSALSAEALCLDLLSAVTPDAATDRRAPAWLARAIDRLTEDVAEDLSVGEVAAAAGVHPFHLIRTFRRFHRCTPGDYRRMVKLELAARMLAMTTLPLAEVALECGFADQSHLTKAFRRRHGMAPGAFRAVCRG